MSLATAEKRIVTNTTRMEGDDTTATTQATPATETAAADAAANNVVKEALNNLLSQNAAKAPTTKKWYQMPGVWIGGVLVLIAVGVAIYKYRK